MRLDMSSLSSAARDLIDPILAGLSEPGLHRGLETSPAIQEIRTHGADR